MKKFRLFSAFLAACILFSSVVYADFADMPEDKRAQIAINNAVKNGILSGYEDGTVRPDSPITRAEMASIITRACGAKLDGSLSMFVDMDRSKWYYDAFSKAYAMGAFRGDNNFNMYPEKNITYQETFTVLSQVFDLLPPYVKAKSAPEWIPDDHVYLSSHSRLYDVSILGTRTDTWAVADWAKVYVAGVIAKGGCEGITISPTENISRAQFAIVMDNLIQNYIDDAGEYTKLPEGNTIIRCDGVILNGVKSNYDIIVADCVGQDMLGISEVNLSRLVVRGCATPVNDMGKPVNASFGLTVSGTVKDIRILRPNIVVDLMYASYEKLYSAPGTSVNLGTLIEE